MIMNKDVNTSEYQNIPYGSAKNSFLRAFRVSFPLLRQSPLINGKTSDYRRSSMKLFIGNHGCGPCAHGFTPNDNILCGHLFTFNAMQDHITETLLQNLATIRRYPIAVFD
jgi:hypothetical protein